MTNPDDNALVELPEGMTAWHGGQHRAPADWDGGPVLFRSGILLGVPAGTIWKLGWDHHYGQGDVIAYSRTTIRQQEANNAGR